MRNGTKFLKAAVTACCIVVTAGGCNIREKRVEEYAMGKETCELNEEDVTKFRFKETEYTILEETVENEELGEWVGYIRQYVAVDENGGILLQEYVEEVSPWTLTKLGRLDSKTAYIITFLNVYENPENRECVLVDVNGEYHKAMMTASVADTDIVFDFRTEGQSGRKEYVLHPENATQLLCDETVYQVTSETVEEQQLGICLELLAQTVTYDAESKHPLSKEDLQKVDWLGTSSQKREQRIYMEVREITGIDPEEAVAVKVNREYLVAKRQ